MGIIEKMQQQIQEQHELERIRRKQAIHDTVLRHLNYIPLRKAMKMTGIKSTNGIHAPAERGELERRYKSEKKPEFSMASIIAYMEKKALTAESINRR